MFADNDDRQNWNKNEKSDEKISFDVLTLYEKLRDHD